MRCGIRTVAFHLKLIFSNYAYAEEIEVFKVKYPNIGGLNSYSSENSIKFS